MDTREQINEDFKRMFFQLTDPEERENAKRKAERAKRIEERKLDTGYVV